MEGPVANGALPHAITAEKTMTSETPREFDMETPFCVAGASYILKQCRRTAKHLPGARLGEDPEELHDVRVAIRRLLTAMITFRACFPGAQYERLYARLAELSSAVARVRDIDVQMGLVRRLAEALPPEQRTGAVSWLEERSEARRAEQRSHMLAVLDRWDADGLMQDLRQVAVSIQESHAHAPSPNGDGHSPVAARLEAHA